MIGCTMATLSRRRLTVLPSLTPSRGRQVDDDARGIDEDDVPACRRRARGPAGGVGARRGGRGGHGAARRVGERRHVLELVGPALPRADAPAPGGAPYFATISGGAIRLDLPKIRVFMVVGTLSSSTQMYSGSLATSPKRGFLIRSHLGSARPERDDWDRSAGRSPASSRRLDTPARKHADRAQARDQADACVDGPFMTRPSIADSSGLSLRGTGSQGNRCSAASSDRVKASRREKSAAPVTAEIHVTSR